MPQDSFYTPSKLQEICGFLFSESIGKTSGMILFKGKGGRIMYKYRSKLTKTPEDNRMSL